MPGTPLPVSTSRAYFSSSLNLPISCMLVRPIVRLPSWTLRMLGWRKLPGTPRLSFLLLFGIGWRRGRWRRGRRCRLSRDSLSIWPGSWGIIWGGTGRWRRISNLLFSKINLKCWQTANLAINTYFSSPSNKPPSSFKNPSSTASKIAHSSTPSRQTNKS